MRLAKFRGPNDEPSVGILENESIRPLISSGSGGPAVLNKVLEASDAVEAATSMMDQRAPAVSTNSVQLLAPIDRQEVWAAGVTYRRSRTARMEESFDAGDCYDKVYSADRPELFFKASPHRVVGPGQPVRIRQDSAWNVPEPELALVLNSRMSLVGFTIGNDMSSRDIEGENPLYLPQAKVYDACCALGPAITLVGGMPPAEDIGIHLAIHRDAKVVFQGQTDIGQMARTFDDLIGYLARDNSFPQGAILLTGTGIVPEEGFTLLPGDVVEISIVGIGTLRNPVEQGGTSLAAT